MIFSQPLNSFFASAANATPAESPSPSADTSRLITLAQRGDRNAVARLYQDYVQRIYLYIFYRVPSRIDAEDLTAEVFVHMVKGLPAYRVTGAPFESWLYKIAATQVADYYRQTNRAQQIDLSETTPDSTYLPEEEIIEQQTFHHLRSTLHQLPEEYQTILILRFVERKTHEEVALLLDKTVSSVKNVQYRALLRLTELLGSDQKAHHYLRGSHL